MSIRKKIGHFALHSTVARCSGKEVLKKRGGREGFVRLNHYFEFRVIIEWGGGSFICFIKLVVLPISLIYLY